MITPSFSLTATERVLPRLALDFTTASLDPRVTFTRSGNTATVTNSSGYVVGINANLPRFDFNPITLACKGLLIEEARTNVLLNSSDITAWNKNRATVSGDVAVSPDGTQNADKVIEDTTATNSHLVACVNITPLNATTYTGSVYLKKGERTHAMLSLAFGGIFVGAIVNLDTGVFGSNLFGTGTFTSTDVGNGWLRCICTATTSSTAAGALFVYLANTATTYLYTGNGTSGIFVWGGQIEIGAFATSYIPTTTTALTRNADVATMTGTNFSSWFNASEGAWYTETTWDASFKPPAANLPRVIVASDGTTANRHDFIVDPTSGLNKLGYYGTATTAQWALVDPTNVTGKTIKSVGAYKVDSIAFDVNAGTVLTDSLATIPTVNQLNIGSFFTLDNRYYMGGWFRKLNYWPQRLTNAEVQAFSK